MMSLLEIKHHMMQVKLASLKSLCLTYQAKPEDMRCLLSHWIKKGKLKRCENKLACGTKCFKCDKAVTEIYEWVA